MPQAKSSREIKAVTYRSGIFIFKISCAVYCTAFTIPCPSAPNQSVYNLKRPLHRSSCAAALATRSMAGKGGLRAVYRASYAAALATRSMAGKGRLRAVYLKLLDSELHISVKF